VLFSFFISGYRTQVSAQANPETTGRGGVEFDQSVTLQTTNGAIGEFPVLTGLLSSHRETDIISQISGSSFWRPGVFQGTLDSMASIGNAELAGKPLIISSISVDRPFFTLVNDVPVNLTLTVDPPGAANLKVHFLREGMVETIHSVNLIALEGTALSPDGAMVKTDSTGTAHVQLQAGYAGQGLVWCVFEADSGAVLMIDGVITNPKRCEGCYSQGISSDLQDTGGGRVALYSGEQSLRVNDLTIPGRGFDYKFVRTNRSEASHLRTIATGDFGEDWAFSYSDRLMPDGDQVIAFRDSLRTDFFIKTGPNDFAAPMEYFEQLRINSRGEFELRSDDGLVRTYEGFNDPNIPGRLIRMEDRNGNVMSFLFGRPEGLSKYVLTTVVDTLGRNIAYRYYRADDSNAGRRGRLKEIEDFKRDHSSTGRKIEFDYDDEGNLISATSPTVQSTPNGNDFAAGKTYRYSYTRKADVSALLSDTDSRRLLHNLKAVQYPNETASGSSVNRETLIYNANSDDPESLDKVSLYTIGGQNATGVPSGGTISYRYEVIAPEPLNLPSTNTPLFKTSTEDRKGNMTEYLCSPFDTLIEKREFTRGLRNNEPVSFITKGQYNRDKLSVRILMPEGNSIENVLDDRGTPRFQQGNLIRSRQVADAKRGGDQSTIVTETTYEPIYQQVAAFTDPRGLDASFVPAIPDPTGRSPRDRYTTRYFFDFQEGNRASVLSLLSTELGVTTREVEARLGAAGIELGLGDLNRDGDVSVRISGNVVLKIEPSVVLLPDSNQAQIEASQLQQFVTLFRYNGFGQMTSVVDPEGNEHTYEYYSEVDPDGDTVDSPPPADGRPSNSSTGGYLRQEIKDTTSGATRNNRTNPLPTNIRNTFAYDDVGNVTSVTDGRDVRTDYFVNELNQVVQIIRAAAVPAIGSGDPAEPLSLTAFGYRENICFDFNNNVIRQEIEDRGDTSNTGGFVDVTLKYDILDKVTEIAQEVNVGKNLLTAYRYDANGNRTLVVMPEGNAVTSVFDERDLLFHSTTGALSAEPGTLGAPSGPFNPRGGVPSTLTFNYDKNRDLTESVDAADTDGSSANASQIAGTGDVTTIRYDGFGRRAEVTDAVGNSTQVQYDPASSVIRERKRGPSGGTSPKDNSGADYGSLRVTEYIYDELKRLAQEDQLLFVPDGVATERRIVLTEGTLTPDDGKITTRYEYDRNSRRTFRIEDDSQTYRTDYDGAGRIVRTRDPAGNTVECAYDDSGNRIEVREVDISQVAGVREEEFLTTYFFDALGRLQQMADNLGQSFDYRYDSRNNLVAMADANGPVNGRVVARRALPAGATLKTNDFGNVALLSYDGEGRLTGQAFILTRSGKGDGLHLGSDVFGIKRKTPKPDPRQGGGDGIISMQAQFDGNSQRTSLTDDNGNQTRFSYDNLNRLVTEKNGVCTPPGVADRCDSPGTITYEYDQEGNVVQQTDENGTLSRKHYDARNRPISTEIVRVSGVAGTTLTSYEYNGLSQLTRASDNNDPSDASDDSIITFARDSMGRIVEESQKVGSLAARSISSSWSSRNHRVALTYPNDREIEYSHGDLDRVATISDRGAAKPIAHYDYIGKRRVAQRTYPINGSRLTYLSGSTTGPIDSGYDRLRRPVSLRHVRTDNSLIVGFSHTYDRASRKLDEVKAHDMKNSEHYEYDAAYRLVNFSREPGGAQPLHDNWKLDGVGNWRKVGNENRQYSSSNELISISKAGTTTSILYDKNGNQTDNGDLQFEFDYRNRLHAVKRKADGLVVATYAYDLLGRRTRKVVTNSGALDGTTTFYLDGMREIEEHAGDDSLAKQYVYGIEIDEPLVMDSNLGGGATATGPGDQRLFYHQNSMSAVYALTDEVGKTVEGYQYDAFGRQTVFSAGSDGQVTFGGDDAAMVGGVSGVGNPFLFNGRRLDETGLYYNRLRYFSPDQGRFIHRDPLGFFGDGINLGNPYAYVGNRPTVATDPLGLGWGPFSGIVDAIGDAASATAGLATDVAGDVLNGGVAIPNFALDVAGEIAGFRGDFAGLGSGLLGAGGRFLGRELGALGGLYETAGSFVAGNPFFVPGLQEAGSILMGGVRRIPWFGPPLADALEDGKDFFSRIPPFDILSSRPLTESERRDAKSVFGNNLNLDKVRIADSYFGGLLLENPAGRTPGNVIYFKPGANKDDIFIHELTHVWQSQNGISWYEKLANAGDEAYGGPTALRAATAAGKGFLRFNTEQQAEIMQDYFNCFKRSPSMCTTAARRGNGVPINNPGDLGAYQPFVDFVRNY